MGRRSWERALFVLSLASLVACSLTSLDGFTSGSEAPRPDGPVGPPGDGSPSAPADGGGGDADFCEALSPTPRFCSDFDHEQFPKPWDRIVTQASGGVAVQTNDSVSWPGSLVTSVAPGTARSGACLRRDFVGPFSSVRVELDMRVEAFGTVSYDLVSLEKAGNQEIGLQTKPDGVIQIDEETPPEGTGPASNVITSTSATIDTTWKHLRWTIAVKDGTAAMTFDLGGTRFTGNTTARTFAETVTLVIGDCGIDPSDGTWRVRFDNVVFDAQ